MQAVGRAEFDDASAVVHGVEYESGTESDVSADFMALLEDADASAAVLGSTSSSRRKVDDIEKLHLGHVKAAQKRRYMEKDAKGTSDRIGNYLRKARQTGVGTGVVTAESVQRPFQPSTEPPKRPPCPMLVISDVKSSFGDNDADTLIGSGVVSTRAVMYDNGNVPITFRTYRKASKIKDIIERQKKKQEMEEKESERKAAAKAREERSLKSKMRKQIAPPVSSSSSSQLKASRRPFPPRPSRPQNLKKNAHIAAPPPPSDEDDDSGADFGHLEDDGDREPEIFEGEEEEYDDNEYWVNDDLDQRFSEGKTHLEQFVEDGDEEIVESMKGEHEEESFWEEDEELEYEGNENEFENDVFDNEEEEGGGGIEEVDEGVFEDDEDILFSQNNDQEEESASRVLLLNSSDESSGANDEDASSSRVFVLNSSDESATSSVIIEDGEGSRVFVLNSSNSEENFPSHELIKHRSVSEMLSDEESTVSSEFVPRRSFSVSKLASSQSPPPRSISKTLPTSQESASMDLASDSSSGQNKATAKKNTTEQIMSRKRSIQSKKNWEYEREIQELRERADLEKVALEARCHDLEARLDQQQTAHQQVQRRLVQEIDSIKTILRQHKANMETLKQVEIDGEHYVIEEIEMSDDMEDLDESFQVGNSSGEVFNSDAEGRIRNQMQPFDEDLTSMDEASNLNASQDLGEIDDIAPRTRRLSSENENEDDDISDFGSVGDLRHRQRQQSTSAAAPSDNSRQSFDRSNKRSDDADDSDSESDSDSEDLGEGNLIYELGVKLNSTKTANMIQSVRGKVEQEAKLQKERDKARRRDGREVIREKREQFKYAGEDPPGYDETSGDDVNVANLLKSPSRQEKANETPPKKSKSLAALRSSSSESDLKDAGKPSEGKKASSGKVNGEKSSTSSSSSSSSSSGSETESEEDDERNEKGGEGGGQNDGEDDADPTEQEDSSSSSEEDDEEDTKNGKAKKNSGARAGRRPSKEFSLNKFSHSKLWKKNRLGKRAKVTRPVFFTDVDGVDHWDEGCLYNLPDADVRALDTSLTSVSRSSSEKEWLEPGYDSIWLASKRGDLKSIRRYLAKGAPLDEVDDRDIDEENDKTWVGKLFLAASKATSGGTPLYWAAIMGHKEVVEYLCRKGAKDPEKAIFDATQDPETIEVLKKHGFKGSNDVDPQDLTEEERARKEAIRRRRAEMSRTHDMSRDDDERGEVYGSSQSLKKKKSALARIASLAGKVRRAVGNLRRRKSSASPAPDL